MLPQERVTAVVPSNTTVPPLALKVALELIVNVEANVAVPLGAVNTPVALTVKVPFMSNVVNAPAFKVPPIVTGADDTRPLKPE